MITTTTNYKTMHGITPIVSNLKTLIKYNFILVALLLLSLISFGQTSTQTFTVSSTWTCPSGVTSVQVECWGGGGAGGSAMGTTSYRGSAGGGAGGTYVRSTVSVTPGTVYTVTVGDGGIAPASTFVDGAVSSGGDSWFSSQSTVLAKGGNGGVSVKCSTSNLLGSGGLGSTSGSIGNTIYKGGDGYTSTSYVSGTGYGGGGGGSGGTSSDGNNATSKTGATAVSGGGAGASGGVGGANGSSASINSGGGGGGAQAASSTSYRAGGNGGSGKVILTWTATPSIAISNGSIAAANVNNGQTNVILQRYDMTVTTANATLTGLTVTTAGTYAASDISNLKCWYQSSSTFNSGTATLLSTKTTSLGAGSQVFLSFTSQAITSGSTGYIFITADIASGATNGNTINIASNAFSNITFSSGTKTGTDPVAAGGAQTITVATPSIAVSANHPTAGTINQNSTNQNIASLAFAVSTANATLNSVSFTTAGTYQTADLVASSFKLYYTTTNIFATTTQLGSAQAVVATGNTITFSGLSQSINSGTTGYVWLSVDVAYNANTSRNISVTSTALSNITFATGTLTGTNPAGAGNAQTFGNVTPNIAIAQNGPTASSVNISTTNAIVYSLSLAVTANTTDFNSLTVTTGGTYQTTDLIASSFKLYYTTANTFASTTQLGTAQAVVSSGNTVTFSGISQNILMGTTGYLWLTVDISPTAVSNRTINITSTAFSNITFAAGNITGTDPAIAGGVRTITAPPSLTEVVFPQYLQGLSGTNSNRVPTAFFFTLNNLNANATYKYFLGAVISSDLSTTSGAGNNIFVDAVGFTRASSTSLNTIGNFSTFTTNSSGSYSGWFPFEPTGNARFAVGNDVFIRMTLNDGAGGSTASTYLTTTNTAKVINLVNSAGATNGTGLIGTSFAAARNFSVIYDNISASGRPISVSFIESDGSDNSTSNSYASFYSTSVNASNGAYGVIIPNTNTNGIKRIDFKSITDNSLIYSVTDADGNWGGSVNTVNPTGGTTALVLPQTFDDLIINSNVTLSAATSVYGTVTVNSGATLTTAGYLTLKSNATATARIAQSAGTISGDVNVERYIPQNSNRAWRTLSVPTYGSQSIFSSWQSGTLITGPASCTGMDVTTNGYSMYTYNASTDNLDGVSSTASAINSSSTSPATYFLYVRGDRNAVIANSNANPSATTLRTTGSVYQGQVSIDISANNASAATTYHLIGNPYVSPININSFLTNANNTNNIENTIYVWDPKMTNTASGVGGIVTLTNNGTSFDPSTSGLSYANGTAELPSGMAFFVQKKSSNCTNCSLVFTESMKSSGAITPNGFKTTSGLDGRMQINLEVKINDSTQGIADGLLALYDAQADMQVSTSEDALKMSNFGENMSIRNGTNLLAIEKRPLRTIDTLAIQTDGLLNRAYTLVFNPSQFDAGVKAQLIDHYLNLTYPIATLNKTTYAFSVDANAASKASNRFELLYNNQNALSITNTLQAANIQVYPNPTDGKVNIAMHIASTENYHAQVFNAFGASVVEQDFVNEMGNSISIDLSAQAKGVYYLKISNAQHEQVVVKIIHL